MCCNSRLVYTLPTAAARRTSKHANFSVFALSLIEDQVCNSVGTQDLQTARRLGLPGHISSARRVWFTTATIESHQSLPVENREINSSTEATGISEFQQNDPNKLPRGSKHDKIRYILTLLPVGSMNTLMLDFCLKQLDSLIPRINHEASLETSLETAQKLLFRLEQEKSQNKAIDIKLTPTPYQRLIRSWARTNAEYGVLKAKALLQHMKEAQNDSNSSVTPAPGRYTYEAFLYACTISSRPEAPQMAEQVLRELEDLTQKDPSHPLSPTPSMYNNVILSHANQAGTKYGAAAAAEDWLLHMSRRSVEGLSVPPQTLAFNRVLKAWAICPEENGAERAQEILELQIKLDDTARPNPISFGTVIRAFANRNRPEDAERVLNQAIDFFRAVEGTEQVDLTTCLNIVISAWGKSSNPRAVERIEHLLNLAYQAYEVSDERSRILIKPDVISHTAYLNALVKSSLPDGVDKADQHLRTMISDHFSKDRAPPTKVSFQTVIAGWLGNQNRVNAAEKATLLLEDMIYLSEHMNLPCKPESGTFNMCIELWGKINSTKAAQESLKLLKMAEKRNLTTSFSYARVINTVRHLDKQKDIVYEAVNVLHRFEQQVDERGLEWNSSHVIGLYTALIAELARLRTREAADKALKLLESIPKAGPKALEPTSKTYTGVMNAFLRLGSDSSLRQALAIFNEMMRLHMDTNSKVRLDFVPCYLILEALAKAGGKESTEHALRIFLFMETNKIRPCAKCQGAILEVLANTGKPSIVNKAAQLLTSFLHRFKEGSLSEQPSQSGIDAVVRACQRSKAKALLVDIDRSIAEGKNVKV